MNVTRRGFLKFSGITAAGTFAGGLSLLEGCAKETAKLHGTKEITGICPFCSMGCGLILSVRAGRIVNIEGDPENPINNGVLCPKGSALIQTLNPESGRARSGNKVKYRKAGAKVWEEISIDEAVGKIAKRIAETRNATFIEKENDTVVNRTDGIALLAGDGLFNEEYYLMSKFARILGISYIDNEARLSSYSSFYSLKSTLGFGAMTNQWTDIRNSDIIMIAGSNPAENNPVLFRHIQAARDRGAQLICVDPRITRSSALADHYIAIRPGTDIAFINGIIHYALQNGKYHKDYLLKYTNAAVLINRDFQFNEGIFSGYNEDEKKYDNITWSYQIDAKGMPKRDKSLKDANTVFQLLKKHMVRYTPAKVSEITGCPADVFVRAAEIFTRSYKPDIAASIICSGGSEQHTTGTQVFRAFAILQLLMGNIGIAGGGINSISKGFNLRGAIDNGFSWDLLPGFLNIPSSERDGNFNLYISNHTPKTNDPMSINMLGTDGAKKEKGNTGKFIVSLLKAWFGPSAQEKNDYCYDWLPKRSGSYFYNDIFNAVAEQRVKGLFLLNTDPLASLPGYNNNINLLKDLDWIVSYNTGEDLTSRFWEEMGAEADKINTEVFLLPAASVLEKEGSATNSSRWVQWCNSAVPTERNRLSLLNLADMLYHEIAGLYRNDTGKFPDAILNCNWKYGKDNIRGNVSAALIAGEISGYLSKGKQSVKSFFDLRDDGTTACGNWVYSGCYVNGINKMERRDLSSRSGEDAGLFSGWAWSWPLNMRILYNMASVDTKGSPWNSKRAVIKWDGKKWDGDITGGNWMPGSKYPFFMNEEGFARLFDMNMSDGPIPEYYEPAESHFYNGISRIRVNPLITDIQEEDLDDRIAELPLVASICSFGEYQPWGINGRNLPWLKELMPVMFCEISPSLAGEKDIISGDKVVIKSKRGSLQCTALVSERIYPLRINNRAVEPIIIIKGDGKFNPINTLANDFRDPISSAPEIKAFIAGIEKSSNRVREDI